MFFIGLSIKCQLPAVVHMKTPLFPHIGPRNYRLFRLLLIRQVRAFERSLIEPQQAQQSVLGAVLKNVRPTVQGKHFSLSNVRTLEEFRQAVPIQSYRDIEHWVERVVKGESQVLTKEKITGFVETSGTQSKPKLIPVTKSWSTGVRNAQLLWVLALLRDFPSITERDVFHLVSSAKERRTIGGLPIGANTGRMVDALPKGFQQRFVLAGVPSIEDVDLRHYVQLRMALQQPVGMWVTANPSTIALYTRKMKDYRQYLEQDLVQGTLQHGPAENLSPEIRAQLMPKLHPVSTPSIWTPARVWPLSVIGCWTGGPAKWFVEQFPSLLGGNIPVRDVGITASEGFFAIPLSSDWDGGVLWNHGELLEFQSETGEVYWGWELEVGKCYQLIITARNGLLRYAMKDTVRVTGFVQNTPIIAFVGKSGRFLNAVGEKVTEEQLSLAMQRVATGVIGFTGTIQQGEVPAIKVLVEWENEPCDIAFLLDQALQAVSVEYQSKRVSQRLGMIQIQTVRKGTYAAFRNWRIVEGASFAQVKDCVIATDAEWDFLKQFVVG